MLFRSVSLLSQKEAILRRVKPADADMLWKYIEHFYHLRMPRQAICKGHVSPFSFITDSFFEIPPFDRVVWANRGGGKTEIGSVCTHLDAVHKEAPLSIRIIGGSFDQSRKMYVYLDNKWGMGFREMLAHEPSRRSTELMNGTSIECLTQSTKAVRGPRVSILRADEADEFESDVWRAVQFVTQSTKAHRSVFECFSTYHRVGGIMSDLIERARTNKAAIKLYQWCLWEVVEPCTGDRSCSRCPLSETCQGIAKDPRIEGFFSIDDAISIYGRTAIEDWDAEMLCKRPSASGLVYKAFIDRLEPKGFICKNFQPPSNWEVWTSIDFGGNAPFCCLFITQDPDSQIFYIYDEIYDEHDEIAFVNSQERGKEIRSHAGFEQSKCNYADRAAKQERIDLASLGKVKTIPAKNSISDGIREVRSILRQEKLRVCQRCTGTRMEFGKYRFPEPKSDKPPAEKPLDAFNHAMDALKNFFLTRKRKTVTRW